LEEVLRVQGGLLQRPLALVGLLVRAAMRHAVVLDARVHSDRLGRRPLLVATYDAELLGHWWFEGPDWLDQVFRRAKGRFRWITASEYLEEHPTNQREMPGASSWGSKGYNEVWLNGANDWIYRHLHAAADRMVELADRFPEAQGLWKRALDQAARELLLAQSSDWAFIMTSGTMVPYAMSRTRGHLRDFNELYAGLRKGEVAVETLARLEARDNLFPDLDYRVYRTQGGAS
jgi:1,4-alpha-glucan branching enzyme